MAVIVNEQGFRPVPAQAWPFAVRLEPFLDELDETGLGDTDEDRVAAFMLLDVAKLMPETLKDDLRKEGLL